jgi:hypothetical protein
MMQITKQRLIQIAAGAEHEKAVYNEVQLSTPQNMALSHIIRNTMLETPNCVQAEVIDYKMYNKTRPARNT